MIAETQDAKMTNEASKRVRPILSAAAERMRLHRERRRRGLRSVTIELRETEIDALVHRGLLNPETRNDKNAVTMALYEHLDRSLGATT
jgi:hypothetical protein